MAKQPPQNRLFMGQLVVGGGSGIRTHDTVFGRIRTFQARAFNHSAIPPRLRDPGTARTLAKGRAQGNTSSGPRGHRRSRPLDAPNRLILLKSCPIRTDETGAESDVRRYNGGMSPLRISGFVLVAVATLFALGSLWYSVMGIASGLSLYDVWYKFLPGSLNWVQRNIWAGLWHLLSVILVMPAWAVVGLAGLICIGLGRRRIE